MKHTHRRIRWISQQCLVMALCGAYAASAQQLHGQRAVFEGINGDRMTVHLANGEMTWLLDPTSHFANGRPMAGDWIHAEVDGRGHVLDVLIEESPARVNATVDHIEGAMVVVRTASGVEMWNETPGTWHLGVGPGALLPGDVVDAGVLRNRDLSYLRLDQRNAAQPGLTPGGTVVEVVETSEAPPPLPNYEVPPCPEPDALWMPGHWRWAGSSYYWVPGVWVMPPAPGLLWTPGYWEFVGAVYRFHAGYWGPHVGFYGGVAYGGGYYGQGFVGARWEGGHVAYNTAAFRVNVNVIHNTYENERVEINRQSISISEFNAHRAQRNPAFMGGEGVLARPSEDERRWAAEPHQPPTPAQMQHIRTATSAPQYQHPFNSAKPPAMAMERPMTPVREAEHGQEYRREDHRRER